MVELVARISRNFPQGDAACGAALADDPMGIHWTGIVFGLGFVMSFGYWTTDFLVVQRILTTRDLRAAKMAQQSCALF